MNKILVIQFRTDRSLEQEQRCIRDTLGPQEFERVTFLNAVNNNLGPENLEGVSHVILGGSGEFFLGQGAGEGTWLPKMEALIDQIYEKDIPLFGICFGHQIMLKHEGAVIRRIPEMDEVGTFPVFLGAAAEQDLLTQGFPFEFDGIFAHKETPVELPASVIVLGSSQRVVAGITRIAGRRAWSVMFHPDMNMESVRERFSMFPHYAESPEKFAEALAAFREAPVAHEILRKFITI